MNITVQWARFDALGERHVRGIALPLHLRTLYFARATHHARPRVVVAVAAVVGILQGRVVENPTDQSDEWNRSASDPWIPV